MLVLDRKLGEKIHVGKDIVITLCRLRPGHARIGVQAPRDVEIMRGELVDRQETDQRHHHQ